MRNIPLFLAIIVACVATSWAKTEEELEAYLQDEYQGKAEDLCYNLQLAEWAFATDINNPAKEQALTELTIETAAQTLEIWKEHFQNLNIDDYQSEKLKRQLKKLKNLGSAALESEDLTAFTEVVNTMNKIYSTGKICPYDKQTCEDSEKLSLEPEIETIMSSSVDYEELLYAWTKWRDETGAKIKEHYNNYVVLKNKVAEKNDFLNAGEMWKDAYETDGFEEKLDTLWAQVEPLYSELHHYVAQKLKGRYKEKLDISDGLIPAHVLGNMWAQSWVNLASLVKPFPDASEVDVTQAMKDQDYKVLDMFEKSNEFYMSLGLADNKMSYTGDSMIEKPEDRDVRCHASAWDFCKNDDFRIKMCTQVDMEDFITVHHEMGHIQYYLQYKNQLIALRGGANPGFHEAVGDTIALSVATPKHLQKVGLLQNYEHTEEASINALMDMALERVAFLPFGLLIDKWRWDVFSGKVTEDKWNEQWWEYRKSIQKVKPPTERAASDFDPAAKYHVAGDSQYINYFVAHILEFQMYRGLCLAAGEYNPENLDVKPLHKCDFYQSTAAGDKLKAGLSLGTSEHWSKALEAMTGETDLDASALLDYFRPLYLYLKQQRLKDEDELKEFLSGEYAEKAKQFFYDQVDTSWNYETDVNSEEKKQLQLEATLRLADFQKEYWTNYFDHLKVDDYQDESLKRQLHFLKVLGTAALPEEKLEELTSTVTTMQKIYSEAKLCPYAKQNCDLATEGLSLEPGIEAILSKSQDYDELVYAWKGWRDATGAQVRDHYKRYVALTKEAARANGFDDFGELWRDAFESETFIDDMDKLWGKVEPLYKELHKFVARKLKEEYGDKLDIEDELIPAHLLGNMWAQSWINLSPLVRPYPDASGMDVTKAMVDQKYTVEKMFDESNKFYTSLGLPDNSMSYGEDAMITKPDRDVVCHASAWDFYDQETFRIKMCTEVDYEDFVTVHHEMGHINYFILYKNQPITLRDGANPGFHEAVGDTIALSVANPTHLEKIGLLTDYEPSDEASINALMDMALERVAFLPFGLLVDKWRWDVFSGKITEDKWNEHWWKYRETIQKVKAPIERSEADFDPGAKYHVLGYWQYISYFVAHILEFQMYRGLCIEAKQYDPEDKETAPLHECDFFDSKEAGAKLKAGLSLGSSKHWKDALEAMTGERELDATALMEYFDPLYKYLKKANGAKSMMTASIFSVITSLVIYFIVS